MVTRKRSKLAALTMGAGLFMFGCATINSPTPGKGTAFEVRGHSYAAVWGAAVRTLERRNFVIVVADREGGMLRAEGEEPGLHYWFSYGEIVGVFIRPTRPDAERYTVEVQSLKKLQYQVIRRPSWTESILAGIQAALNVTAQ